MKMAKRIFVCLIVLAIGVSMLALGVSAADSAELKYTPSNHGTILEYYDEPIIFDLNFDGEETVVNSYVNDKFLQVPVKAGVNMASIVEGDAGNKYLQIAVAGRGDRVHAYLNWNAEEGKNIDDFLFNFSVKMSGTGSSKKLSLYVADAPATDDEVTGASAGTALLTFDFSNGAIVYYDSSDTGKTVVTQLSGDVFYDVSIDYSVIDGNYDVTVTAEGAEESIFSITDVVIPYESIGNVRLGMCSNDSNGSTLCFDNVSAVGGSFIRYEADKLPETERAISDFITICESDDFSLDDKLAVLETAFKLVLDHGIVGSDATAAENIGKIQKIGVSTFVGQISDRIALLTDDLAYDERVRLIGECTDYVDLIPEDISYMGDEIANIEKTLADYEAEKANLDVLKSDSEAILAALADVALTNTNVKKYSYIKTYYDAIADYTPYLGYPGIPEIIADYETVIARYEELTALGNEFIANTLAAADAQNSFGVRYAAYVAARDNYFEDTALEGIEAAHTTYASVDAEMTVAIDICEHFLLNVSRADYSQYLSAKKSALDAASRGAYEEGEDAPAVDTQLNIIKEAYTEYPGMSDALDLYDELVLWVSASEKAALDYVSAVQALAAAADTLSKEELAARITAAEELQKTGDVTGVDGVTEANILLNELKAQLELSEGYKEHFSTIVGNIESVGISSEMFGFAHEAYEIIGVAARYEGVDSSDAAKLEASVNAYNEYVRALNEGFKAANEVACNTVSASSGSPSDNAPVGLVASIIKKFYE